MKNLVFLSVLLVIGMALARWALSRAANKVWPTRLLAVPLYPVFIGYLSPNAYIFMAALALVPILVARDKRDVAAVMLVLFATTPTFRVTFGEAGRLLLITDSVAAVGVGSLIALMMKPGQTVKSGYGVEVLMGVLLVAIFVIAEARDTTLLTYVRQTVSTGLIVVAPIYVLTRTVRTRADLEYLSIAIVTAAVALGVIGMYEGLRTWPLYQGIVAKLDQVQMMSLTRRVRGGFMRAPGPFAESTSFGFYLTLVLLFAISTDVYRSMFRKLVVIGVIGMAVFLTQSRGAWIGLLVGLIAMLFHLRKTGLATGLVLAAVLGYGVLSVIPTQGTVAELTGQAGGSADTATYRKQLLERGLEESRGHRLIGQDLATVRLRLEDMRQGEGIIDFVNFYLYALLTTGLVGLFVFLAISVHALKRTLPRPSYRRPRDRDARDAASHALFAAMAAAMTMVAFTSLGDKNVIWYSIIIGLAGATGRLLHNQRSETRRPAPLAATPSPA